MGMTPGDWLNVHFHLYLILKSIDELSCFAIKISTMSPFTDLLEEWWDELWIILTDAMGI